jgi:hypothetical protein
MSDVERPEVGQSKEEEKKFKKSSLYNWTKRTILGVAIIILFIGILGSMKFGPFSSFDMSDFVSFLDAYKGMFITLTASVGAGGAVKNLMQQRSEEKDDGRDTVMRGDV